MSIDVRQPVLPDMPSEWAAVPHEILAMLAPQGFGYLSPAQKIELNKIARGRRFLIRNEAIIGFERPRCRQCGRKHTYVTVGCVEAVFNGLRDVQLFYQSNDRDGRLLGAIRPGTIVPITPAKARELEQRVRDRRYQPIRDQAPPTSTEINAGALTQRIHQDANRARHATEPPPERR